MNFLAKPPAAVAPADAVQARVDAIRASLDLRLSNKILMAEENLRTAKADRTAARNAHTAALQKDFADQLSRPSAETERLALALDKQNGRVAEYRDKLAAARDAFASAWLEKTAAPALAAADLAAEVLELLDAAVDVLADINSACAMNGLPGRFVTDAAPQLRSHVRACRAIFNR